MGGALPGGIRGHAAPPREKAGPPGRRGDRQYLMVRRKYLLYWVMLNDTSSEMVR